MNEGRSGASWDVVEDARLKSLWAAGRSASEIAAALGTGRSRCAVISRVHRLGLSARRMPASPPARVKTSVAPKPAPKPAGQGRPGVVWGNWQAGRAERMDPQSINADGPMTATVASIHELSSRMCRWPIGDPLRGGFGYCGRASAGGMSYCAEHSKIAYQPAPPRDLVRDLRRYV